ncbi:hypothetical protein D3H65_07965 [Paraflavitalea soli]|uniref:Uncharacterized protein n=1 Tax=Paraflavitalea soli TaxID=2315862 RepID=A0A3B7MKW7_9BACT|nr:hypothetical protein [Paraflavitalea soli]AXY73919.1 hypothetical protein D3H65_07965 [Paraflavitalea soli]
MKQSKALHFWAWFRRNQHHYLHFDALTPAAKAYWMAELQAHAAAYHRFLAPYLYYSLDPDHKRCKLVISALGRTKSFKAADRLIHKAPRLTAWDLVALMPAASPGEGIAEELATAGLRPDSFWFDVRERLDFRKPFYVFVDTRLNHIYDLEDLAEQALFNVLGERVFGEHIEYVRIVLFSDVLPENMAFLAPLEELPGFMAARDLSGMVVGKDGGLQRRF